MICKDSRNFTQQLNIIREAARTNELPPDVKNAEIHLSKESISRMKSAIERENAKSN
jgi:hypothetical protein